MAEAKNKFSELVNHALAEGPQRVVRHNDTVIVMALQDYEKLIGKKPVLIGEGPELEGLDLSRDHSSMRDVSL